MKFSLPSTTAKSLVPGLSSSRIRFQNGGKLLNLTVPFLESDAPACVKFAADPDVMKYTGEGELQSIDSAKDYVSRCIRAYETHGMRAIAYRSQRLPRGRCFRIVLCFLALVLCLPTTSHSQTADFTPEVFGGIGLGRLSRSGNRRISPGVTLDDSAIISAGFSLRHRSGFGLEIEFSRMLDPSPRLLGCDAFSEFNQPCLGSGRDGPDTYSLVSANALYHFATSRFQPYVASGLGVVWSAGFQSSYFALGKFAGLTHSSISESEWNHTGAVSNIGGGMRIFLSSAVSVRPEIRLCDVHLPAERRLRLPRSSMVFGYHW